MNIERQNILNQIFQECLSKGLSCSVHPVSFYVMVNNSNMSFYSNAYYDGELYGTTGIHDIHPDDLLTKIKEYK